MNLLLIVLPVLAFMLAGLVMVPIALVKLFDIASSRNKTRDILLALTTMVAAPILTIALLVYRALARNAGTDYDNLVDSGDILFGYIFGATFCFLIVGIAARMAKFEGYKIVFWGALAAAFSVPVALLFLGDPVYAWLGDLVWPETIRVRKIHFH